MNIAETVKEHPLASLGVLAVGCLVLFALLNSGGSANAATADPTSDPGYLAAELNAGTQLQMADLAYRAKQDELKSNEALAALTTTAALNARYSDNDTALKIATGNFGLQSKAIDAQTALGSKSIDADTAVKLGQFKQVTDVARITSDVNIAGIQANRDVSINNTKALAEANKYTAQLGAQTAQLVSNNATSVQKQKGSNDFFGNLLGTAAAVLPFLF